jgi:hypothetical protein
VSGAGSTLSMATVRLAVAELGEESPLPMLRQEAPLVAAVSEDVDAEMRRNLAYGKPHSLLPYAKQDWYGRSRTARDVQCAILQNDMLSATFLPGYGGRLWSLVDRASGRELLHRSPVVQPANLALRDAWLAGGVEWNLGTTGHWPLTCSPLHVARVRREDGAPVLRMYEYERLRGLIVQLDFCLPTDSSVLLAHVTLYNPSVEEVPVYWWSNIAVPEAPDVRVLAPATAAYHFDYAAELRLVPFPGEDDRSRTTKWRTAADYFFAIADGRRPWIAALDGQGSGLVHTSTAGLRGRKLFGWGTDAGGAHWQEWLGEPGSRYLEIQAGLARTQMEHLPMPGGATWSWTEAYGLLAADAGAVAGKWSEACDAAASALEALVPAEWLEQQDAVMARVAATAPDEVVGAGSGWGALERRAGFLMPPAGTPFAEGTLGEAQSAWLGLLDRPAAGFAGDPLGTPPPSVVGDGWERLLEAAPVGDWCARLHLGRLAWSRGDADGARRHFELSLAAAENPWALRDLAETGHPDAADLLVRASALRPDVWQLTAEALAALLDADRPQEALALLEERDSEQRVLGRIRLLECRAAVAAGDVARAAALLDEGFEVHNLREGEVSLDALWRLVHPDRPLPRKYDFRMRPEG